MAYFIEEWYNSSDGYINNKHYNISYDMKSTAQIFCMYKYSWATGYRTQRGKYLWQNQRLKVIHGYHKVRYHTNKFISWNI